MDVPQKEKKKKEKRKAPDHDTIKWLNKCYGYIRVSTKHQKEEGLSLENQRERLKAWAVLHYHTIEHIYADEGVSGTSIEPRKQLIELLAKIKQGETLVAVAFSRLSRSARDFLNITYEMRMRGCRVVIINEGLDTNTPYGRFTATMFSAVAELEADIIKHRVKDAMNIKKEKGEFVGRVPYGWKQIGGPGTGLVEIPEEQAVISMIKSMRESFTLDNRQYSFELIALKLTEAKIKPPGKSVSWTYKNVSRIYSRKQVRTKGRSPGRQRKGKLQDGVAEQQMEIASSEESADEDRPSFMDSLKPN